MPRRFSVKSPFLPFTLLLAACLVSSAAAPMGRAAVVGLWRFDEASGSSADGSGNGNLASPVGPNVGRQPGKPGFGNAASFINNYDSPNPARSYFQTPGNYALQVGLTNGDPWSFTAWTRLNSDGFGLNYAVYPIVLSQKSAGGGNSGFILQGSAAGDNQYYTGSDSNTTLNVPTGATTPLDVWVHTAVVYDGADYVFYRDGVEQKRTTVGLQNLNFFGYDGALQIGGGEARQASRNWDGLLDDVAVFNQALTPTQISTVMAGNFASFISPLPPPVSAQWQSSGFGLWSTNLSWGPVVIPNTNAITAVFGGVPTAPTTVVADQTQVVRGIEFNHTLPYAIAGAGSLVVGPASGNGSIAVSNAGAAVTHEFQLPVQLAANVDVSAALNTVLEFDHQLRLAGRTLTVSGAGRVNVNSDSTSGTPGAIVNSGTLGGAGTILGTFTNAPSGKLAVEISGAGPLGVQGLAVTGAAVLGGTLQISLLNGFTPANGATFDVLTAGSITNNGLTLGGASSGFNFSIVGGNTLRLTYGAGLSGDYDGSGRVEGRDFLLWQRGFNSNVPPGSGADGSGNGLVDGQDFNIWKAGFGTPATTVSTPVPEPTAFVMFALAWVFAGVGRRPRRMNQSAAAYLLACAAALIPATGRATVLTFDFEATANRFPSAPDASEYTHTTSSYSIVPEYGDRVNGPEQLDVPTAIFGQPPFWYKFFYGNNGEGYTPNVSVNYVHAFPGNDIAFRSWVQDYGGLDRIAYPSASQGGPATFYMTLKGDAGVNVTLSSLQVDRFKLTGDAPLTVKVYSGIDTSSLGPQLFSSGSLLVTQGVPRTISPNVTANELTLALELEDGGTIFNWGFDNVVFSQSAGVTPTSVTWARPGSGQWTQPANWSPDYSPTLVPDGNDRTAIFGNATSGPATIVLDHDVTIKTIQFNHTQPYLVGGTNLLTLQANVGSASIDAANTGGAVTHQLTAPVRLQSHAAANLASGVTLEINNKLSLGAFNLVKSGAGTLRINNVVESTGGTVSATAGVVAGSGALQTSFLNNGAVVAPGNSPGVLTVEGDFRQTAGSVSLELGGPQRGLQYDVLAIGGELQIYGGLLEVATVDGFVPRPGDVFDVLDFSSALGAFDALALPPSARWDVSRLMIDGTITALAIPEPSATALALLCGVTTFRRRR